MRISTSTKWLIITVIVLLQLSLTVYSQIVDPTNPTSPKPSVTTTTSPKPQPSSIVPSSSVSSVKPTSLSTLQPVPSSSSIVSSTTTTTTLAPTTPPVVPTTSQETTPGSSTPSSTASATSPSPSKKPENSDGKSDTALIVGCVVGGVVGIALIGGILACINRRGGCTKKRDNKKSDFEDYGLGDFPHHRTPVVAAPVLPTKPISPTLPRLNDQGNYYNEDPNYGHYGYQDNNMDYGMQPQQGYYYPQQQHQQEYYDDGGYYYDSNTSATAYSSVAPMQHQPQLQQAYMMNNAPVQQHSMISQDVYKPDEVGSPIKSNSSVAHHIR